ncbi:N-glycosylase/DNA lyase [Candidatus Woesearchaeota archaeon]|jgi:N-glycosylase/DNA lyase|nr:N-glycosylase/DNA lyase [Candidatus Woesearchaeota archaeon]MBT5215436.1 N-glycosylase/DNA lyase [Candidatus Woesearchaeota archaeon]MBT6402033.1 N-glycosylase/DNA lyase [Candidatus Woesearchaeota archaeon]
MKSFVIEDYNKIKSVIATRLNQFSKIVDKSEIFYELCFCLLTPQSNAKRCALAIEDLKELDLFNSEVDLEQIGGVLKTKTRFHNNKAKYVHNLKPLFEDLWKNFDLTDKNLDSYELRNWLIKNIKGLGFKESSHFLRNIGFRNLAILDRHILRNLHELEVIGDISKGLSKNEYLLIEEMFSSYCINVGISMDELDLYFWYSETGEVFK